MRVLPSILSFLSVVFLAGGCFHRANNDLPYVYQGWEARYQYDMDKRRLISLYNNKQVGRSWGKSESGSVNYDRWWGGNRFFTQDLLAQRLQREEQEARRLWGEEQRILMEAEREARKKAEEEERNEKSEEPGAGGGLAPIAPIAPVPLDPLVPLAPLAPLEPIPETPAPPPVGVGTGPMAPPPPAGGGLPPLPGGFTPLPGGMEPGGGGFAPLPEGGMPPGGEAPLPPAP